MDLPVGIRLVTIYLTNEEYSALGVKRNVSGRHCKTSKFVWTAHDSDHHPSSRAQSRGENSKRKEMEIIPEKMESMSAGEREKGYFSDASVESKKSRNQARRSSNLWTPADHPTQITQGFESPSEISPSVENTADQDVSISDLENDAPKKQGQRTLHQRIDQDSAQDSVLSNTVSSSDDSTRSVDPKNLSEGDSKSSQDQVNVDSKEITSKHEFLKDKDTANSSDIEIRIEHISGENRNVSTNLPEVSVIQAVEDLSLSRTPEILSDVDTVDTGLSGSESPETRTAEGSEVSSADQLKERLEFPGEVLPPGVGMLGDEMSDIAEERVPPSSVNSSIRSSVYSSFKSSQLDSLSSECTVQEEDVWYPKEDNLQDAILYVQGHSEISLLLLLESSCIPDSKTVQSLVNCLRICIFEILGLISYSDPVFLKIILL